MWEYGIPVVVKHVSEPTMHAVPAVAKHPDEKYLVCQSLDNTITVYETANAKVCRWRCEWPATLLWVAHSARNVQFRSRTKTFKGHMVAGYACDVAFSTDGQFLVSGYVSHFSFVARWIVVMF